MNGTKYHHHNGWQIHGVGGFCTIRHFWAMKNELTHWAFKLKECKVLCDIRDKGEKISDLHLKSLYS